MTSAPTPTASATPSQPASPTPTKTSTPTATPTKTATVTKTSTATNTNVPANTPTATSTAAQTATKTSTATNTNVPANTPTATSTATQTATNTATAIATVTPPGAPAPKAINATFLYDGDGNRVAQTIDGVTTYFVTAHYELTGSAVTKYYFAGAQRVAMRKNGTLYYLFTDHLGSTSLTTDSAGNVLSELRYKPWGETRYTGGNTATRYQYTGQFSYESDFGLYFYNARWLDVSIGRFAQADTIIPQGQGVQAWDRYAFVNNNPVKYTDPSGHALDDGCRDYGCDFGTSGSTSSSSSYTPAPAGGNNGGSNDNENCNGLECIQGNHEDNDITLPTVMPSPQINWSKVAEGTVLLLLLGTLDYALIAGVIAFASEIFVAEELTLIIGLDGLWITGMAISIADAHVFALNLIWEGFTGEENKIPYILIDSFVR